MSSPSKKTTTTTKNVGKSNSTTTATTPTATNTTYEQEHEQLLNDLLKLEAYIKDIDQQTTQSYKEYCTNQYITKSTTTKKTTTKTTTITTTCPSIERVETKDSSSGTTTSTSTSSYNHYSILPKGLVEIYELCIQGTEYIQSNVTKYTLLKTNPIQQIQMLQQIIHGCQLLCTVLVTLYNYHNTNNNTSNTTTTTALTTNLSSSTFYLVPYQKKFMKAIRTILHSVVQLVTLFQIHYYKKLTATTTTTGTGTTSNILPPNFGALETGMVWDSCDQILGTTNNNKKKSSSSSILPRCYRDTMYQMMISYMKECDETITEFQTMIDYSTIQIKVQDNDDINDDDDDMDDDDDFESIYTNSKEISVVTTCLGIIVCSKNSLRFALRIYDIIGKDIDDYNNNIINNMKKQKQKIEKDQQEQNDDDTSNQNQQTTKTTQLPADQTLPTPATLESHSTQTQHNSVFVVSSRMSLLAHLYHIMNLIGIGITDLGSCLYPPLSFINDPTNHSYIELMEQIQYQITLLEQFTTYLLENTKNVTTITITTPTTTTSTDDVKALEAGAAIPTATTLPLVEVSVVVDVPTTTTTTDINTTLVPLLTESLSISKGTDQHETLKHDPVQQEEVQVQQHCDPTLPSSSPSSVSLVQLPLELLTQVYQLRTAIEKRKTNAFTAMTDCLEPTTTPTP